jgi:hypothetical protein
MAEMEMHMTRLRLNVNELQTKLDEFNDWKNLITPLIQMMAVSICRSERDSLRNPNTSTTRNNRNNNNYNNNHNNNHNNNINPRTILEQANDLSNYVD